MCFFCCPALGKVASKMHRSLLFSVYFSSVPSLLTLKNVPKITSILSLCASEPAGVTISLSVLFQEILFLQDSSGGEARPIRSDESY